MEDNNREWQYDAFISYRHLEPDAFVAGSLHKILESYKLPGNLVKNNKDNLKRRKINKVFRDAEELPLTSNLNDTIMTALENSEYLIAICSPKFGESLWCKKEVDTFIKLRGADHVLTVLVDGEPSESFPEALLYRNVENVKEDGSIEIIREPMEPLAANARGASNRERLKQLKTESLRLMAPMFGCSFDDLKQRHREQKMKRTMSIIGGVAAVCLIFGIVSSSMALKISRQNGQITEQNKQILEQSAKIEEQYQEAVISNANAVADYARNIYEDGDRIEAIKKAYSVLSLDNYVPKVEYLLSDALNLYENGRFMKADRILKCGALVKDVVLSPSGDILLARTNDDVVTVWNTVTGAQINSIILNGWVTEKDSLVFKDDNSFFLVDDNQIKIYDIAKQQLELFASDVELDCTLSYSSDSNILLATDSKGAKVYDADSQKLLVEVKGNHSSNKNSFITAGRETHFALSFFDYKTENTEVWVCDTGNGNVLAKIDLGKADVACMKFYGDGFYILTNETVGEENNYLDTSTYLAVLRAYSIADGEMSPRWTNEYPGVFARDVLVTNGGNSSNIACQFYDIIELIDKATGNSICRYNVESQIVSMYGYKDSELYSAATRDGRWLVINPDSDEIIDTGFFDSVSNNIEIFKGGSCTATVSYSSGEIVLYRYTLGQDAEEIEEISKETEKVEIDAELKQMLEEAGVNSSFVHNVCYDNTGRFMSVAYMNHTLELFRIDADKKITDKCAEYNNMDIYAETMTFSPDEKLLLISDVGDAYLLRCEGIDLNSAFPREEQTVAHISNYCGVDFENKCVYVSNYNQYYKIPLYSTEEIGQIAKTLIDESR